MTNFETYKLYNGEVELQFNPVRHLYTANGKRAHGTTSALSTLAKPGLIYWAVDMACESMAQNIKPGIAYDEIQIKDFLEDAKEAHTVKRDSAANKGTIVHSWISSFIKGESPAMPINEELRKSVEAFLAWQNANEVDFLHSEVKVYSKKYNYAGTCDFIARVNGKLVIGDIKTSSGIYPEMFYQTAAYQFARREEYHEYHEDNLIVRCGKDGTLEVRSSNEFEENFKAFLGALALYNRQQKVKDVEYQKLL